MNRTNPEDRELREEFLGLPRSGVDVLLVTMPFGPEVLQPSLGLSLLEASLEPLDVSSKVRYFTLKLAEQIGIERYHDISSKESTLVSFAGDWVFNGVLFDSIEHDVDSYVEHLHSPDQVSSNARDRLRPLPEKLIQTIVEVRELIPQFVEDCLLEVLAESPKIIGFTSTFQQHVGALALARRIKEEAPESVIVFGGANCEGIMGLELLRQFDFVDAVVSGEGDLVFPQMVERILSGREWSDIPGVNTAENSGFSPLMGAKFTTAEMVRDMDALPNPDYSDFFEQFREVGFADREDVAAPRVMFESSRGCWWGEKSHCTFCGLNGSNMKYRAKSEDRALEELISLKEKYPESPISASDNILDMKYFRKLIPELASRDMDLDLFYEVKANLRKEQLQMMRAAGIREMQPGIESLLDEVLDLMRKGVRGIQNIQLLKWAKQLGIQIHWNMLWGFPGESPEAYQELEELLPLLYHLDPPTGQGMIRIDRFSPNFNEAESLGFADVEPYPAFGYVYPFEPEVLANLSYFFIYGYQEPRNVKKYTDGLQRKLEAWRENHEQSALFFVDKGDTMLIWDFRPGAQQPLTVLDGDLRRAVLACDKISSRRSIASELSSREYAKEEIDGLLEPLVKRGLILRDGDCYLSLAVPLGEYSPKSAVVSRLSEVMEEIAPASEGTHRIDIDRFRVERREVSMAEA